MKPTFHLLLLAGLLYLLAGSTLAMGADRALLDDQLKNMPPDVVSLAERELACRGWLNTAIIDAATDYRVQHALIHLRCDMLAVDTVTLRRKYEQSPSTLRALDTAGDTGP